MEKSLQVRPWVRLWARSIDLSLYVLIVYTPIIIVFLLIHRSHILEAFQLFVGIFLLSIYFVFEAIMLCTWGYTPGKRFLGIKVRDQQGNVLKFSSSLYRSFNVFLYGMGLNLPFFGVLLPILSFLRLKSRGITFWDEIGAITVKHQTKSLAGVIIGALLPLIIIFVCYVLLMIIELSIYHDF